MTRLPPVHRLIIGIDTNEPSAQASAALRRPGDTVHEMLRSAFAQTGIDWKLTFDLQARGEGVFVLLSPRVPSLALAAQLPGELLSVMGRHNESQQPQEQLRVRLSLHAGEVREGRDGWSGAAIDLVAHLLSASELSQAVEESEAGLAVIASESFYQNVIAPAALPGPYRPVQVRPRRRAKDATRAWIWLPHRPSSDQGEPAEKQPLREPLREKLPKAHPVPLMAAPAPSLATPPLRATTDDDFWANVYASKSPWQRDAENISGGDQPSHAPRSPLRERLHELLEHLASRAMLLARSTERRTQIVIIAGAFMQALEDQHSLPDSTVDHLANSSSDPEDVRRLATTVLSQRVIADGGAFQEFIELLTTALMLERTSLGGGAQSLRHTTAPSEISAVSSLGAMLGQADRIATTPKQGDQQQVGESHSVAGDEDTSDAGSAGRPRPRREATRLGGAKSPLEALPVAADSGALPTLEQAIRTAFTEGESLGQQIAESAPALWVTAVLARKPRMPSDLEARLLQGSVLPIDSLLHDEVRHALRQGFWTGLEQARR